MTTSESTGQGKHRSIARGQSEVIAVVLIVGIVLAGTAIIVGFGAGAIGGTESQLSDQRAEKTLTQLDSKAGLVALGEANSQRISVPTEAGEQYRVVEDEGWMEVAVTNLTDESEFEVMSTTLGAVVYENENETMAYQGGGVWRATDNGGSMISPPEFHYRDGTLTLPAVTVTGDRSLSSNVNIDHESEERKFPLPGNEDRLNPLDNHRVEVTVQSSYYRGWGEYFATRTDGSVDYDHENNEVTVTLVTPINVNEITAASASLSAGGEFHVSGSPASTCKEADGDVYTSSFNSSDGTYCDQWDGDRPGGTAGDLVYGKDIDISDGGGNSYFYGDVTSGQTVTITNSSGSGQPTVFGNISYADKCLAPEEEGEVDCQQRISEDSDGTVHEIGGVPLTESIDWFIETSIRDIEANADETDPDLDGPPLEAGEYYFESFDLADNEELELDTTDGTVVLAVNDSFTMEEDAEISVLGNGTVELYVGGVDSGDDMVLENDAAITADNNNGTQFRTYGGADFDARLGGGGGGNLAVYTGVIYAPPGSHGTGSVTLYGAEVFGGILTGETNIPDGGTGSIHYDEALEGERVVPDDARIIRVTYLHVTQNTISVSG